MNSILSPLSIGIITIAVGLSAPAQAGKNSVDPFGPVFTPPPPNDLELPPGDDSGTADFVVKGLEAAKQFCGQLANKQYAVDCISERLAHIARQMPATGEFAEARAALLDASQKLNALAVENRSTSLPRARATRAGANPVRTTRPLTPVRLDRLEEVNNAAAAILEETETILLRSADRSAARQVNYARIAEAIGSNKLLLRSL